MVLITLSVLVEQVIVFLGFESQTFRQTVRQSDSQTVRQSDRQTDSQTVSQTVKQTVRQSDRQSVRHSDRQSDSQTVRQSVRQSDSQTVRQSDRQSDSQTVRQSDRPSGRQSGRQYLWNLSASTSAPSFHMLLIISSSVFTIQGTCNSYSYCGLKNKVSDHGLVLLVQLS